MNLQREDKITITEQDLRLYIEDKNYSQIMEKPKTATIKKERQALQI